MADSQMPTDFPERPAYVVGIDVGGTNIKVHLFELLASTKSDNSLHGLIFSGRRWSNRLKTRDVEKQIADAAAKGDQRRASAIIVDKIMHGTWTPDDDSAATGQASEAPSANRCIPEDIQDRIIAMGFSLPAPIEAEEEVPLAPSNALARLFGVQKIIADGNPLSYHAIDLTREVSRYIQKEYDVHGLVVTVLNDGVADIGDDDTLLNSPSGEGRIVVFKLGTGLATALIEDGAIDQRSNEFAKAQLDIAAPLISVTPDDEETTDRTRFPSGATGNRCSSKAFSLLNEVPRSKDGAAQYARRVITTTDEEGITTNDVIGRKLGHLLTWMIEGQDRTYAPLDAEDVDAEALAAWVDFYAPHFKGIDTVFSTAQKIFQARRTNQMVEWVLSGNFPDAGYIQASGPGGFTKEALVCVPSTSQDRSASEVLTDNLSRFALIAATLMGRWIADGIAHLVDVVEIDEVRLAGGPLNAASGIVVATSVCLALESEYGFEVDVDDGLGTRRQGPAGNYEPTSYRPHEVKHLRVVYPPYDSGVGGARGAAKAALAKWEGRQRNIYLDQCRDWVASQRIDATFTIGMLRDAIHAIKGGATVSVTDEMIKEMLARNSAGLGLTWGTSGRFQKV